jgi:flagellar hook-associated protein 1 FlgK
VSTGSSTISDQLANLFAENVGFSPAGSLGSSTTTFAGYAANIVAGVAAAADRATAASELASTNQSGLEASISSQSGVNLDEETARLSELENMYATATQIFSTINAMFESLMDAVQTA